MNPVNLLGNRVVCPWLRSHWTGAEEVGGADSELGQMQLHSNTGSFTVSLLETHMKHRAFVLWSRCADPSVWIECVKEPDRR